MTVTHRKRQHQPDEIQSTYPNSSIFPLNFSKLLGLKTNIRHYVIITALNEPGLQIHCDACGCDLTHSIRIKCADPACEPGDGVDLCPGCFCAGKEFAKHRRDHKYRVVVGRFTADFLAGSLWISRN
jgi:transcriptional adapter 2-alpha